MNLTVRFAGQGDADAIAQVRITTWKIAYQGLIPQDILDQLDAGEDALRWHERLANLPDERQAFVIEVNEPPGMSKVVGFAVCGPDRDLDPEYPAELYALYVLPGYQGLGAGRKLVSHVVEWLRTRGYERMLIYVLRDNHAARKFYEALGGKIVREKIGDIRGVLLPEVGYGYDLENFL